MPFPLDEELNNPDSPYPWDPHEMPEMLAAAMENGVVPPSPPIASTDGEPDGIDAILAGLDNQDADTGIGYPEPTIPAYPTDTTKPLDPKKLLGFSLLLGLLGHRNPEGVGHAIGGFLQAYNQAQQHKQALDRQKFLDQLALYRARQTARRPGGLTAESKAEQSVYDRTKAALKDLTPEQRKEKIAAMITRFGMNGNAQTAPHMRGFWAALDDMKAADARAAAPVATAPMAPTGTGPAMGPMGLPDISGLSGAPFVPPADLSTFGRTEQEAVDKGVASHSRAVGAVSDAGLKVALAPGEVTKQGLVIQGLRDTNWVKGNAADISDATKQAVIDTKNWGAVEAKARADKALTDADLAKVSEPLRIKALTLNVASLQKSLAVKGAQYHELTVRTATMQHRDQRDKETHAARLQTMSAKLKKTTFDLAAAQHRLAISERDSRLRALKTHTDVALKLSGAGGKGKGAIPARWQDLPAEQKAQAYDLGYSVNAPAREVQKGIQWAQSKGGIAWNDNEKQWEITNDDAGRLVRGEMGKFNDYWDSQQAQHTPSKQTPAQPKQTVQGMGDMRGTEGYGPAAPAPAKKGRKRGRGGKKPPPPTLPAKF